MTESTNTLQDICDIFSILHDGRIVSCIGGKNLLLFQVECSYLAERINSSYQHFFVECTQIDKLELNTWMPNNPEPVVITDIHSVFKNELVILYANIEHDYVKIDCVQGTLLWACNVIQIFDEGKRPMTIDELDKICVGYWDGVSKQIEEDILAKRNES